MKCSDAKTYLETVCAQIRWKRSHVAVSKELSHHIEDQAQAFRSAGLSPEEAQKRAVEEMGDPLETGVQLDRSYRPRPSWSMVVFLTLLLLCGALGRVLTAYGAGTDPLPALCLKGMFTGGVLFFIGYFADYTLLAKRPFLFYGILTALCVILFLFSTSVNGRGMYLYGSPLPQYLPLFYVLAFSGILWSQRNKGAAGAAIYTAALFPGLLTALSIPSIFTGGLLLLCHLLLGSLALKKKWFCEKRGWCALLLYLPIILGLGYLLITRWDRLLTIFVLQDPMGQGYVTAVVRELLGSIPGAATQNPFETVPGLSSDFMITYLLFRFGKLLLLPLLALFALLFWKGTQLAQKQKSTLAQWTAVSILFLYFMQAIVYLARNLGLAALPMSILPFFSPDNAGLTVNLFLAGILLSVFRTADLASDALPESRPFSFGIGRLNISIK